MKKRVLIAFIVLLMLLSTVACGNDGEKTTEKTTKESSTEQNESKTSKATEKMDSAKPEAASKGNLKIEMTDEIKKMAEEEGLDEDEMLEMVKAVLEDEADSRGVTLETYLQQINDNGSTPLESAAEVADILGMSVVGYYELIEGLDILSGNDEDGMAGGDKEYALGEAVVSDQLEIIINSAVLSAADQDGKALLSIDITVSNHDDGPVNFMAGINLNGVYTKGGNELEFAVNDWTFPRDDVAAGGSSNGLLTYYVDDGSKDFHMIVTPDLNKFGDKAKIVFSVDGVSGAVDDTETDSADDKEADIDVSSLGRPAKMKIVSETTAFGMTTVMTTYYNGADSRTETVMQGLGKSVLIHMAEDEVMYQYVEGESSGVMMTGASTDYAEEMGLMSSGFSDIIDRSSEDMTATEETLNGEKVIYIEATESDEDMGEMLVKMWYSEKYAAPLKYEVYAGETLWVELKVTEVTDKVKITDDMFELPDNMEFEEVDMALMMAEW